MTWKPASFVERMINFVRYVSTRGQAATLGFIDAMLAGLARDGGLYTPETLAGMTPRAISALAGLPYAEAAARIVAPFVTGEISDEALAAMAEDAYADFRHPAKAPVLEIGDNLFLLELFHGPTLAFKDFAGPPPAILARRR
jgi:threonine synthase